MLKSSKLYTINTNSTVTTNTLFCNEKKSESNVFLCKLDEYKSEKNLSRYQTHYKKIICPDLILKMNIQNVFEIPKIEKIILNTSSNRIIADKKHIIPALISLEIISGQKLKYTSAEKSIASFKLRKNQIIGCKVNLQNQFMFDFLEKVVTIILPKIREFSGINMNSFNCYGNLTLGLKEILSFPELENYFDDFQSLKGVDITIVTKSKKKINIPNWTKNDFLHRSSLILLSGFQLPAK